MSKSVEGRQFTILAVDDTQENLSVINGLLSEQYRVLGAIDGLLALNIAESKQPDLILLDIMMPEMDGYEVCRRLKESEKTRDIPVIFLTAKAEVKDEVYGLELGAVDYIVKPISPPILDLRVKMHFKLKEYSNSLEKLVERRTDQLAQIQDATILAMGALAEQRDPETGNHIRRTQSYIKLLAEALQDHPRFKKSLSVDVIELLYKAAPLHDIGKVAVPDNILKKPGALSDAEYEVMKGHSLAGKEGIVEAESVLDEPQLFLIYAREIAWSHHEKWDGSGYPQGIKGEDIPMSARLMALADVYDALISRRVYKPPFSQEKTEAIILEGRGTHFDPDIVDAFMRISDEFYQISLKYTDSQEDVEASLSVVNI